jgi:hypothetical protein
MLPADVASEVGAYQQERLRELAQKPNTSVLQVEHDSVRDPWPVARLRPVMEGLLARVLAFDASTSDFVVRKTCLDDAETLEFQRAHPKLYWSLTDREQMRQKKARDAVTAMLRVREKVESGEVTDAHEADALATRTVMAALQGGGSGS